MRDTGSIIIHVVQAVSGLLRDARMGEFFALRSSIEEGPSVVVCLVSGNYQARTPLTTSEPLHHELSIEDTSRYGCAFCD